MVKRNARFPLIQHKKILCSLWLNCKHNPHWVQAKLAAMAPRSGQMNIECPTWNVCEIWTMGASHWVFIANEKRTHDSKHLQFFSSAQSMYKVANTVRRQTHSYTNLVKWL
jgi:hypothetical protein